MFRALVKKRVFATGEPSVNTPSYQNILNWLWNDKFANDGRTRLVILKYNLLINESQLKEEKMKPPLTRAGKLIDSPFPVSRQNFVYCEFYHVTCGRHFYFKWSIFQFSWNNFAESFYNLNYGSSIITSKVCQINSVLETERLVFPEKGYFKKGSF